VSYDADTDHYSLTPEQAFALADPNGPVNVPGAFTLALGALSAVPAITEAFRTGSGLGWHEQHPDVIVGCEQFFRPGYAAHLVQDWLPALDGVIAKLERGGRVADVGCGLGASTVLLAQAYPQSHFTSSDYHDGSVELARKRAAEAGGAGCDREPVAGGARRRVRRAPPPAGGGPGPAGAGRGRSSSSPGRRGPGRPRWSSTCLPARTSRRCAAGRLSGRARPTT
jgi:hypothetical protein